MIVPPILAKMEELASTVSTRILAIAILVIREAIVK